MHLSEEQITSFQNLYKKAFNKEISRTEALEQALALIRGMHKRNEVIPNNLRKYREQAGYTQRKAAACLGFTNPISISHWEQGVNIPNLINLFKLSKLYGVPPTELYGELYDRLNNSVIGVSTALN